MAVDSRTSRMKFANAMPSADSGMKFSTWTPMNDASANLKVFEERRELVNKWFEKWNDAQRKKVLEDLVDKCKTKQLLYTQSCINKRAPVEHTDFTKILPRVVCLYIFSHLDPRSLCRSTQVCWYWKYLSELDQLWMPKCLRLGWYINFTPSPFEQGIWKRHYLERVQQLHFFRPGDPAKEERPTSARNVNGEGNLRTKPPKPTPKKWEPPPWKVSDKSPGDTKRFNYLDNKDYVASVRESRSRGSVPDLTQLFSKSVVKKPSRKTAKLVKAKSASKLDESSPKFGERPGWAQHQTGAPFVNLSNTANVSDSVDAGKRPGPARNIPRLGRDAEKANSRSERDPPTAPLFKTNPWTVPVAAESDDEDW
ncbi:A Receptor for Ubiquitination Targets [Branchiostoma belcheri]|nr:A Receptor for Ubiquitination Targets [Branchiostoma belcheri]